MNHDLIAWAARHHVSVAALEELRAIWGDYPRTVDFYASEATETSVQARCILHAPHLGMHLFRNNVGALKDTTGRQVRFGLANDSKTRNEHLKSGDLIGIAPVLVTPNHVGQVVGQFVSVECKRPGWRYTGVNREPAQLAWIQLVLAAGGRAKFVTCESEI